MEKRRLATSASYLGILFYAVSLTLISPMVPRIAAEFHAGLARVGILFTCHFAGFITALLIAGLCAGRIPKSRLFVAAGIGLGASLLCFAVAPSLGAAFAVIFFIGGCGGLVESLGSSVLAGLNPDRVGPVLNISQVFFALGALAGPALVGFLLVGGFAWRWIYAGAGLIGLAVFLPMTAIKFADPAEVRFSWSALRALLSDAWFLGVLFVMAAYVGVEVGLWGWLSAFLEKTMAFSPLRSSLAVSLFWGAMMAGRAVCSRLTRGIALPSLILILLIFSVCATALLALPVPAFLVWPLIALVGLAFSGVWPTVLAYGGGKHTEQSVLVFSLIVASGGVGGTIVPAAVGAIAGAIGFRGGLLFLVGVELLAVAAVLLLRRREPRHG